MEKKKKKEDTSRDERALPYNMLGPPIPSPLNQNDGRRNLSKTHTHTYIHGNIPTRFASLHTHTTREREELIVSFVVGEYWNPTSPKQTQIYTNEIILTLLIFILYT